MRKVSVFITFFDTGKVVSGTLTPENVHLDGHSPTVAESVKAIEDACEDLHGLTGYGYEAKLDGKVSYPTDKVGYYAKCLEIETRMPTPDSVKKKV